MEGYAIIIKNNGYNLADLILPGIKYSRYCFTINITGNKLNIVEAN